MRTLAQELNSYVVVPIWELQQTSDTPTTYNTAVLLGRNGR